MIGTELTGKTMPHNNKGDFWQLWDRRLADQQRDGALGQVRV